MGEEDGQGDFPVRGCRCLTWPAAAALKERQLTLSWEPVGTHGDASALQGKEGESTVTRGWEMLEVLSTFKPERNFLSSSAFFVHASVVAPG